MISIETKKSFHHFVYHFVEESFKLETRKRCIIFIKCNMIHMIHILFNTLSPLATPKDNMVSTRDVSTPRENGELAQYKDTHRF